MGLLPVGVIVLGSWRGGAALRLTGKVASLGLWGRQGDSGFTVITTSVGIEEERLILR